MLGALLQDEPSIGVAIRRVWLEVAQEKGFFALHADEWSHPVYDLLFLACSRSTPVRSREAYLQAYPSMLVFGDGGFTTRGYAPGFIEDWITEAREAGRVVENRNGALVFSDGELARLRDAVAHHAMGT